MKLDIWALVHKSDAWDL